MINILGDAYADYPNLTFMFCIHVLKYHITLYLINYVIIMYQPNELSFKIHLTQTEENILS